MLTRNLISAVRQNLNSYSLDNFISGEYIFDVALSHSKLLIKRESDSAKLFKNTSLFRSLGCIKMESVPISTCSTYIPKCLTIQKSKLPIPAPYLSNFGSLVIITNLTRDKDYKEINPLQFKSQQAQEFKPKHGNFWIEGGYIYIPNSNVEEVTGFGLFENVFELNRNKKCFKILDEEFPTLPYMESTIIELTTNTIVNAVKIPADANSNLNSNDNR